MISILKEVIEPMTQGAIWGTAGYLASKAGADKPASSFAAQKAKKKHLIQAGIGAAAGTSGALGAAGISKLFKKAKEAADNK